MVWGIKGVCGRGVKVESFNAYAGGADPAGGGDHAP